MKHEITLSLSFAEETFHRAQRVFARIVANAKTETPNDNLMHLLEVYGDVAIAALAFRGYEMLNLANDCVFLSCEIQAFMAQLYGIEETPQEKEDNLHWQQGMEAIRDGHITKEDFMVALFPERNKH